MAGLAGYPIAVFVQQGLLRTFVRSACMTICAGDFYIRKVMGFNIRTSGYLVSLDSMAGSAFHAFGHMNVGIFGGRNAMLVIRRTTSAGMTAQTHLVRGFLDILGSLENVHAIGRNDLELIPFFRDFSLIIGGMTNEAINVVIISIRYLTNRIRLVSESRMTLNTTTWLCRFRGVFGLKNSNPVVPDNRIRGSSIVHHHAAILSLRPILHIRHSRLMLVVQADRHIFGHLLMAGQARFGSFVFADQISMAGLCSSHLRNSKYGDEKKKHT